MSRPSEIAALNDKARTTLRGCKVMLTCGVTERGDDFVEKALTEVQQFNCFTDANDPHCEHDFGKFIVEDAECFFKFEYYDRALKYGSEDPADETLTTRVLTLMLVEEY